MPGRNPREAHRGFVDPITKVLACLTWRPLELDAKPVEVGVPKSLILGTPTDPVKLEGELADGAEPALFVGIDYTIIEEPDEPATSRFRVTTEKYTYHLYSSLQEEVLLYHWHPDRPTASPHLHVGKHQLSTNPSMPADMHIPTARVALESVALFLIEELGVKPIHPTYREIIDPILENFVSHRHWHV